MDVRELELPRNISRELCEQSRDLGRPGTALGHPGTALEGSGTGLMTSRYINKFQIICPAAFMFKVILSSRATIPKIGT